MSRGRIAGFAFALIAALALCITPGILARDRTHPPPVYVGANGQYIRGTQGTYCWLYGEGHDGIGACAEYAYPLPVSARLTVVGRQRLSVDAGMRATHLNAALVRVEGESVKYVGNVRVRGTGPRRFWKLRLPADLKGADVLDLSLDYRNGDSNDGNGDSNVWAGLSVEGASRRG